MGEITHHELMVLREDIKVALKFGVLLGEAEVSDEISRGGQEESSSLKKTSEGLFL